MVSGWKFYVSIPDLEEVVYWLICGRPAILPAKEIAENQAEFQRRLHSQGRLTPEIQDMWHCFFKDTSSSSYPDKYTDFEAAINDMSIEQLQQCTGRQLKELQEQKISLSERRTKGWRKGTTWLLFFSKTFNEFLLAYSGVIQLLSTVDAMYGNAATGTLSLLFVVNPTALYHDILYISS